MCSQFDKNQTPRAVRFTFAAPVRYRRPGDRGWMQAVSVNMSHTGLLFSTFSDLLPDGNRIEFRMRLPNIRGMPGGEVRCAGHVARTMPGRYAGDPGAIAVAIGRYVLAARVETPVSLNSRGSGRPESKQHPKRGE